MTSLNGNYCNYEKLDQNFFLREDISAQISKSEIEETKITDIWLGISNEGELFTSRSVQEPSSRLVSWQRLFFEVHGKDIGEEGESRLIVSRLIDPQRFKTHLEPVNPNVSRQRNFPGSERFTGSYINDCFFGTKGSLYESLQNKFNSDVTTEEALVKHLTGHRPSPLKSARK